MAGETLRLAANFTLAEALTSRSYPALQYHARDVPQKTLVNAVRFAAALQQLRDFYSIAITINSWIRSSELNDAVGGASRSRHVLGCAADFTMSRLVSATVFSHRRARETPGFFDRLAYYETTGHLHADIDPDATKRRHTSRLFIVTTGRRWEHVDTVPSSQHSPARARHA